MAPPAPLPPAVPPPQPPAVPPPQPPVVDVLEMQQQAGWPSVRIQEPVSYGLPLPSVDALSMTGDAVGAACAAVQPDKPIEVNIYIGAAAGGSAATQPIGALPAVSTPIEGVGSLVPKLDDMDDFDDDDMDF